MKHWLYLLLLFFVLFNLNEIAAQCPSSYTVLSSQSDVDSFSINYPNCSFLNVELEIEGADIQNLDGLSELQTVQNFKISECNKLLSLQGLENISLCKGKFSILSNDSLLSLEGLNNLRTLWSNLTIESNGSLVNLTGLDSLQSIGSSLHIGFNPELRELNGISKLESLAGDLIIEYNPKLSSLEGFASLKTVRDLRISSNEQLNSFEGLDVLETVTRSVSISQNPALDTLTGFPKLKKIKFDLDIYSNENLTEISAFNVLESFRSMNISFNDRINKIQGFPKLDTVKGQILIVYNDSLESITGFQKLSSLPILKINSNPLLKTINAAPLVGGHMREINISNNEFLRTFNGLHHVNSVSNYIQFKDNKRLWKIQAFEDLASCYTLILENNKLEELSFHNLELIHNNFYFNYNTHAIGFEKFTKLKTINGIFQVTFNDSLQTFSGLDSLESIDIFRVEFNPTLTSFLGLNQLKKIKGAFTVRGNEKLVNFQGLNQVEQSNAILLFENNSLKNFQGLNNLKVLDGAFTVSENDRLMNFEGLESLNQIQENTLVTKNDSLENFRGLRNISTFQNSFHIVDNDNLQNFEGLENLDSIFFDLAIQSNTRLKNLTGLQSLCFIGNNLVIESNNSLTKITALDSLKEVKGLFNFSNNYRLSTCNIQIICANILNIDKYVITGNQIGCENIYQIIEACITANNAVIGFIYYDEFCDSVFIDGIDISLENVNVFDLDTGMPLANTNQNGEYVFYFEQNNDLSFYTKDIGPLSANPQQYTIQMDSVSLFYPNADFRYCADSAVHNLAITVSEISPPRPGFEFEYQVYAKNLGIFKQSAILTIDFLQSITNFIEIIDTEGGVIDGYTITWDLDDLDVFETRCFNLRLRLQNNAPLGNIVRLNGQIEPTTLIVETTLDDNKVQIESVIVGSFDPNDKNANSHKITVESNEPGRIEYTIRFQNTGTYPAEFIEILDTLESKLDIRTIEMISASHPYRLTFPAENILKWLFEDINLVDSTTNEAESHGFIRFAISTIDSLPLYDSIENRVGIYFDFNEPVITNTTIVTTCPPFDIILSTEHPNCDLPNGSVAVQVQQSGNFTYEWSNGMTSPEINNLLPGFYRVTVTGNVAECFTVESVVLQEILPLFCDAQITNQSNVGMPNGSISTTVINGLPPYHFLWSTGDTTQNLTQLEEGDYSLTVTDANDCSRIYHYTVLGTNGLQNTDNQFFIKLDPNPNRGFLHFSYLPTIGKIGLVQVTNAQGKLVFSKKMELLKNNALNIRHLPSGHYTLSITERERRPVQLQFIIQK